MPITNRQDASDVDRHIERIFNARSTEDRVERIRRLFVDKLDFRPLYEMDVPFEGVAKGVTLPAKGYRLATLESTEVVYVDLSETEIATDMVRKSEASEAARLIEAELGGDLLMVFTNRSCKQIHFILPNFASKKLSLRRMIVERDSPRRTANQQIAKIFEDWDEGWDVHTAMNHAFDVEAVKQNFFREYKRVFDIAMATITGFGDDDSERESKNLFVQTTFNRLMFIYFISRKGWLEFGGGHEYLEYLWDDYVAKSDEGGFYASRLRPLFFKGLNEIKYEKRPRSIVGDVPFVNGGLFHESDTDKRECLYVPDGAIKPLLTEVFDRFNFTVMESTPWDVEVAVDPEMLGKVFEELVTARHDSGAYYTPREVVSFMCREALKGYLAVRVGAASRESIERFVDDHNKGGIGFPAAQQIAAALELIKVVDPACGSGAYLMGMMHELVTLHTALFDLGVTSKKIYDLKLKIIRDNLYGADNDGFAINIAMLRLWLSLSIDYDGVIPEPLPNLDFKIVGGDSLLGPDPTPETVGELSSHWFRTLNVVELKAKFMDAHDRDAKEDYRQKIVAAEDAIRNSFGGASLPQGVVDWRVTFAEVFADARGFDVVVANPPYVRQEKIGPTKPELRRIYADSTVARSDLYCYFYVRGLQLLRSGGMHVFVCSNSWLDVGYGAKLQERLLKNARVDAIYESAVERQFSTAQINTIISVVSKSQSVDEHQIRFVSLRDEFETAIADATKRRETLTSKVDILNDSQLNPVGKGEPTFVGDKWGAKYLRAPDIYRTVLTKGQGKFVRLGEIATVRRGVTTGANAFFILTQDTATDWGIEDAYLKPVMLTSQESMSITVDPSGLSRSLFVCDSERQDLEGSGASRYIKWGEDKGFNKRRTLAGRRLWYDLGVRKPARLVMNYQMHATARTFYSDEGILVSDNLQEIHIDADLAPRLCVSMNSSITQLQFNVTGRSNFGGGMIKIQTYELANLPVVDPSRLCSIDVSIFRSDKWDVLSPSPERKIIDDAVFDLIGLSQGERDGVYEGVEKLVQDRVRRARSV